MSMSVAMVGTVTLVATASLMFWDKASPTLQEQTSLLNRVATRVELARVITPETSDILSAVLDRARNGHFRNRTDPALEQRFQTAILRFEQVLRGKLETRLAGD
jgi:hypothetical protein